MLYSIFSYRIRIYTFLVLNLKKIIGFYNSSLNTDIGQVLIL